MFKSEGSNRERLESRSYPTRDTTGTPPGTILAREFACASRLDLGSRNFAGTFIVIRPTTKGARSTYVQTSILVKLAFSLP
jgi:hypothetical protein